MGILGVTREGLMERLILACAYCRYPIIVECRTYYFERVVCPTCGRIVLVNVYEVFAEQKELNQL